MQLSEKLTIHPGHLLCIGIQTDARGMSFVQFSNSGGSLGKQPAWDAQFGRANRVLNQTIQLAEAEASNAVGLVRDWLADVCPTLAQPLVVIVDSLLKVTRYVPVTALVAVETGVLILRGGERIAVDPSVSTVAAADLILMDAAQKGPKGDKGDPGAASTVAGPKGDKGDPGAASTVAGPKGDKGDLGAASTVAGPKGDKGDPGAASTVAGPKGDKGDPGAASTVAGPKGDKGDDGAASTVAGPKGDKGDTGSPGNIRTAAVFYVDSAGDDTVAEMGNPGKPWGNAQAAALAALAAYDSNTSGKYLLRFNGDFEGITLSRDWPANIALAGNPGSGVGGITLTGTAGVNGVDSIPMVYQLDFASYTGGVFSVTFDDTPYLQSPSAPTMPQALGSLPGGWSQNTAGSTVRLTAPDTATHIITISENDVPPVLTSFTDGDGDITASQVLIDFTSYNGCPWILSLDNEPYSQPPSTAAAAPSVMTLGGGWTWTALTGTTGYAYYNSTSGGHAARVVGPDAMSPPGGSVLTEPNPDAVAATAGQEINAAFVADGNVTLGDLNVTTGNGGAGTATNHSMPGGNVTVSLNMVKANAITITLGSSGMSNGGGSPDTGASGVCSLWKTSAAAVSVGSNITTNDLCHDGTPAASSPGTGYGTSGSGAVTTNTIRPSGF